MKCFCSLILLIFVTKYVSLSFEPVVLAEEDDLLLTSEHTRYETRTQDDQYEASSPSS